MRTLEDVRKDIDKIDETLIAVILKRIELSGEVKKIKEKSGKLVFDASREEAIIQALQKGVDPLHHAYVAKMYQLIFEYSREIQERQ